MASYDDYQLEEMENSAVNKSKNLKRGIIAGASVVGAGGIGAVAANQMTNDNPNQVNDELTSDDLINGANVGTGEADNEHHHEHHHHDHHRPVNPATSDSPEVHIHNHYYKNVTIQEPTTVDNIEDKDKTISEKDENNKNDSTDQEEHKIITDKTDVVYDTDGNVIAKIDSGTIDGKMYKAVDTDNNGKANYAFIDKNNNGEFEEDEYVQLDNDKVEVGKGQILSEYVKWKDSDLYIKINERPNPLHQPENPIAQNNIDDIHNEYEDERTNERYFGDVAQNNPDYNNRDGSQYRAGMNNQPPVEIEDRAYIEVREPESGVPNQDPYALHEYVLEEDPAPQNTTIVENQVYLEPDQTEHVHIDPQPMVAEVHEEPQEISEPIDYGYSEPTDDFASLESEQTSSTDDDFITQA